MGVESRHGMRLDALALEELDTEEAAHAAQLKALEGHSMEEVSKRLEAEDLRHYAKLKEIYARFAERTMRAG